MEGADMDKATPFIGAWKLVSFIMHGRQGETAHLLGEDPQGLIVYHECGYMSAQLANPSVPKFADDNQWLGAPEEIKAAFEGFVSYYGTYSISEESKTVTHHVEVSLFPNWVGQDQVRFYDFSGNRLTLSTGSLRIGDQEWSAVLVWERIG
ncbi:MAG: lipocalin-like domain-containing protein [Deltaproteobacteria bacterium]|nr:lipocalin-like domain-containing protein [Deltaproteobacteria bacterium]